MIAFYQTATYWAVPTKQLKCGAPGWDFVDTVGLANAAIGSPWQVGGDGSQRIQSRENPAPDSVDRR